MDATANATANATATSTSTLPFLYQNPLPPMSRTEGEGGGSQDWRYGWGEQLRVYYEYNSDDLY